MPSMILGFLLGKAFFLSFFYKKSKVEREGNPFENEKKNEAVSRFVSFLFLLTFSDDK